jgi:DNA-binding transcriptional regulator YdaS (Cro superfamily)
MNLHQYLSSGKDTQTGLAAKIGLKSSVLVNQWANGVRRVPAEHCPLIEKATNGAVRCEDLRPDMEWSVLRSRPMEQAA